MPANPLADGSLQLIATAATGIEAIVAREVHALGYPDTHIGPGSVTIDGVGIDAIPRLNLWLRSADRVKLVVGSFEVRSFEALFDVTRALPWAEIIPRDAEFPVIGRSIKSQLASVSDCQAIVKKAVVEALRERYRDVHWFTETGALYRIEVALRDDRATLTLDTSGEGLHKRGYRTLGGTAPLRETLAATLVQLSYWRPERALVDLFCGSGTIPIEAALIGRNLAPGLHRRFAAMDWPWVDQHRWAIARAEAMDRARRDQALDIQGSDIDPKVIAFAEANAAAAGVASGIAFKQMRATDFSARADFGVAIANPPYGERMGADAELEQLYRNLGRLFRHLPTWSHYWLSGHPRFEKCFGRPADRRRKLFNAGIPAQYYQYLGPSPPREQG
jgi:putative N6-adenine-specific DNA methylase